MCIERMSSIKITCNPQISRVSWYSGIHRANRMELALSSNAPNVPDFKGVEPQDPVSLRTLGARV